jgi:hypothetical protein
MSNDSRLYHVVAIRFRGEGDRMVDESKVYMTRTPEPHHAACVILAKMAPYKGTRHQLEPAEDSSESPSGIIYLGPEGAPP